MRTPFRPGGTLRLQPRPQTRPPAPDTAAAVPKATAALPGSPAPLDPAARKQAQLQFEREQQRAAIIRRHQQTRDILAMLRTRWPGLFTTPVPLAVGVTRAIRAELGEGLVPVAGLSRALHYWTNASDYLAAIAVGEVRRNLDGTEAGAPDEAQRRFASESMERRAAQQATRLDSRPPRHFPPRAQAEAVLPETSNASQEEGKGSP